QLLVELGTHRANLTGARATEQLVELGERSVVEAAIGAVDVDLDLLAEVLGHHPDITRGFRKRFGPERALERVVPAEACDPLLPLGLATCIRVTRTNEECRKYKQGHPIHVEYETRASAWAISRNALRNRPNVVRR